VSSESNRTNQCVDSTVTLVQFKVYVRSDIAAAFKSKCLKEGVSMSRAASMLMAVGFRTKSAADAVDTRGQRRKAVTNIAARLEKIIDAESQYMDRIPENLSGSSVHEMAEQTIECLEEALDLLNEAY
jgi:hypothetical protein